MQTTACCTCVVHVSGVVNAELDLVWTFVKSFGDAGKWLTEVPGVICSTALLVMPHGSRCTLRVYSYSSIHMFSHLTVFPASTRLREQISGLITGLNSHGEVRTNVGFGGLCRLIRSMENWELYESSALMGKLSWKSWKLSTTSSTHCAAHRLPLAPRVT
jgi:hypothetical protein